MCDSNDKVLSDYDLEVRYYSIGKDLRMDDIELDEDEWLYVVNYYGQLTDKDIFELKKKYGRVILDNAQAYFQRPAAGIDTIYTCRKFFGVSDGAILYTDSKKDGDLPYDESFARINFLVGRFRGIKIEGEGFVFSVPEVTSLCFLVPSPEQASEVFFVSPDSAVPEPVFSFHKRVQPSSETRVGPFPEMQTASGFMLFFLQIFSNEE